MGRRPVRRCAAAAALVALVPAAGCTSGTAGHVDARSATVRAAAGSGTAAPTPPAPATVRSAPPHSTPAPSGSRAGSDSRFGPDAVSFVSAIEGWALAEGGCGHCGVLYRTTDAGRHWRVVARPTLPGVRHALSEGLMDMSFADARDGYIFTGYHCASACLLATHDGGRSWHAVGLAAVAELVVAGGRAYALTAAQSRGNLLLARSPVGSDDWTPVTLPVAGARLRLAAQGDALALLRPGQPWPLSWSSRAGRLWYSADRGRTWSTRPVPCTTGDGGAALVSLALDHPAALLVDCFDGRQSQQEQDTQHHLYGSADTGRTWVRLADPTHIGAPVLMADNGAGHAFLATGSGGKNILAATLDGAAHWHTAITARPGFFGWADLRFVSASVGFVLGPTHYAPVHLYRTTDGGRTWHQLPLPARTG